MKKIILIISVVFIFITAHSQTQKGNMYVSGVFNLTNNHSTQDYTTYNFDDKNLTLQFTPGFSYFIKDNWAIGTSISFSLNSNNDNSNYQTSVNYSYKNTYTNYYIGLNTQYYINRSDKFKLFIQGGLGYSYMVDKEERSNNTPSTQYTHYNTYSIGIHPGVVYFVNKHFGITSYLGSITYNYETTKNISTSNDYHNNHNSFVLGFNLTTLRLGVRYCF